MEVIPSISGEILVEQCLFSSTMWKPFSFRRTFVLSLLLLLPGNPSFGLEVPADLKALGNALNQAGFKVLFEQPPRKDSYGLINTRQKTIWIAPITVEMGIFRSTYIHEAVHAAQSCPTGKLSPIGWDLTVDPAVSLAVKSILYRNYKPALFDIEREAFLMQGQTDAVKQVIGAIQERC